MKSAAKAKIPFLTVVGGLFIPLLFFTASELIPLVLKFVGIKTSVHLWDESYESIVLFWEFFFTKESYPPPFNSHFGYHSNTVINITDLTIMFICGVTSYVLAITFVKDKKAENLSIC